MAANAQVNEQITATVKSRLAELRLKSYEELETLPEADTSQIEVAGKPVTLTTYRVNQANGTLVVVQACRERFFGIGANVYVEGFVSSPSGINVEAPEESLWDYT